MNAALSGSERLARPTTLVYVTELIILVLVVATALAFDFTNGFHDTGNAMATSIATGALKPKVAVALSAVLNLVGAFLSLAVAADDREGPRRPGRDHPAADLLPAWSAASPGTS